MAGRRRAERRASSSPRATPRRPMLPRIFPRRPARETSRSPQRRRSGKLGSWPLRVKRRRRSTGCDGRSIRPSPARRRTLSFLLWPRPTRRTAPPETRKPPTSGSSTTIRIPPIARTRARHSRALPDREASNAQAQGGCQGSRRLARRPGPMVRAKTHSGGGESDSRRIVILVCDGLGVGEAPDAAAYGDSGSNTLSHVLERHPLSLPHLEKLGLLALVGYGPPRGARGRAQELSEGKDTTTGH